MVNRDSTQHHEYSNGKFWFSRKKEMVTLGVTQAAVDELGEIASIELPDAGSDFIKGDIVATIEGSLGKLELTAPIAGVVDEVNSEAKEEPEAVSEDPLEEGWLVRIEIEEDATENTEPEDLEEEEENDEEADLNE